MTKPLTGYEKEIAILHAEARLDAELIEEFKGVAHRYKQAIERVRELHESTVESMQVWEKAENGIWYLGYRNFNVCRTCRITQNIQGIVYPCATIQALNGDR